MTMAHVRYQSVFVLSWFALFLERFWASYWPAVSVLLAFIGLAGIPLENMNIRNIGIIGYVVLFPVAAVLLALLSRRQQA